MSSYKQQLWQWGNKEKQSQEMWTLIQVTANIVKKHTKCYILIIPTATPSAINVSIINRINISTTIILIIDGCVFFYKFLSLVFIYYSIQIWKSTYTNRLVKNEKRKQKKTVKITWNRKITGKNVNSHAHKIMSDEKMKPVNVPSLFTLTLNLSFHDKKQTVEEEMNKCEKPTKNKQ